MPREDDQLSSLDENPEVIRGLLAAVLRSSDDAIFSKDTTGTVTSWNAGAERLYGYSADEMIGRSISVIVPSDRSGEELDIMQRVLAGEDVHHFETRRVTRDGRVVDVSISATPLHGSEGTVVGASVITRDITVAKTTRGLADRLVAIVEGSEDAIYSKDRSAVVDSWNHGAERLYGYSADEAIGRHIRFLVPLDHKGEETDILNRVLGGERIENYDTERLTKSGDVVKVSISVSPVHDDRGVVVGAAVIARDVEARSRRERLQSSLDRTELIARVAHDLRNPIATLIGMATMLAGDVPLSDDRRRAAGDAVERQGDRVTALIDDLLDLSYLESGRYRVDIQAVDVVDVVKDALETAPPPEQRRVMIDVPPGAVVDADAARLGQVLVNLLTNAYKYGGDRIRVTATPAEDRVAIEVGDNGTGIPEAIRETLFEPFTRGHEDVAGTGLGLTITSRLVEAQGGTIRLGESRNGARFVIELSRAPAVEEPAS